MLRINGTTTTEEEEKRTEAKTIMTRSPHPSAADEPEDVSLRVELVDACRMGGSACWPQFYYAMVSLSPEGVQMKSPVVCVASPFDFPVWHTRWNHILRHFPWGAGPCLRVEIIRLLTINDPQPTSSSAWKVVVGRAEVPLPKRLRQRKGGRFDLVKLEGRACVLTGTVGLHIELLPLQPYYPPTTTTTPPPPPLF